MYAVSSHEAREVKTERPEGTNRRIDYIGSPGIIDALPQAFYVDRLYKNARIDPHFHDIDQYQVVVDGSCKMGKKAADPITFQYADAYTPYGPIIETSGEGFAFFTLRPIASGGFLRCPETNIICLVEPGVISLGGSILRDLCLMKVKRFWKS
jgi:hypothetical protein